MSASEQKKPESHATSLSSVLNIWQLSYFHWAWWKSLYHQYVFCSVRCYQMSHQLIESLWEVKWAMCSWSFSLWSMFYTPQSLVFIPRFHLHFQQQSWTMCSRTVCNILRTLFPEKKWQYNLCNCDFCIGIGESHWLLDHSNNRLYFVYFQVIKGRSKWNRNKNIRTAELTQRKCIEI